MYRLKGTSVNRPLVMGVGGLGRGSYTTMVRSQSFSDIVPLDYELDTCFSGTPHPQVGMDGEVE